MMWGFPLPPESPPVGPSQEKRAAVTLTLNRWKRERDNQSEVIDLILEEMALRDKYAVPKHN